MVSSLCQRWVQAAPALFNGWKVESRSIRDRLEEIGIARIGIGSRNGRVPPAEQSWHRLRENMVRIKIRVMAVVAVARPPAIVDGELRQIRQPSSD